MRAVCTCASSMYRCSGVISVGFDSFVWSCLHSLGYTSTLTVLNHVAPGCNSSRGFVYAPRGGHRDRVYYILPCY